MTGWGPARSARLRARDGEAPSMGAGPGLAPASAAVSTRGAHLGARGTANGGGGCASRVLATRVPWREPADDRVQVDAHRGDLGRRVDDAGAGAMDRPPIAVCARWHPTTSHQPVHDAPTSCSARSRP